MLRILSPKRAMTRTTVGWPSGTREMERSETPQRSIDLDIKSNFLNLKFLISREAPQTLTFKFLIFNLNFKIIFYCWGDSTEEH